MARQIELSFIVQPRFEGRCLRDFLRESGVSATLIKAVKNETGGFWVGDGPARTCDPVHPGQMVTFVLPPEPPTSVKAEPIPLSIAYESPHVMVLEKPAGMAVHPTLNYKEGTLANAYMGLLQQRGESGVFRPVNRIDKDTSGLVLCAKNVWAASLLAKSVRKEYLAVVEGEIPGSGVIEQPIGRAPDSIILRRVTPEGKPSRTEYAAEQAGRGHTLVRVVPVTGRTHQIRVHFSYIGHPLAGDDLYGGSRDLIGRHALHCAAITFEDPVSHKPVRVESELPKDMQALLSNCEKDLKNL